MKILVAIKRVIDPYVKIRILPDNSGVVTNNVKMSINPFDEIAVEEAVRLKEQGIATEIVVVSIGAAPVAESLRTALALGADRAIHIVTDETLTPLNIAKVLQNLCKKEQPNLVLMGKQSIDGDNNQTGQMLSALLGWAQGTNASKITIADPKITVTREVDGGLDILELQLPAVITTDLRLNEPRYVSLPNIMQAKRKSLESLSLDSLDVKLKHSVKTLNVSSPPMRTGGTKVASVTELVAKLRNELKLI